MLFKNCCNKIKTSFYCVYKKIKGAAFTATTSRSDIINEAQIILLQNNTRVVGDIVSPSDIGHG